MIGRLVSLAVGAGLAALVLWYLLTPKVLAAFGDAVRGADWPLLAAATLLSGAVQWLRAWRFSVLTYGTPALPDGRLVRIACKLNALNFLLPFRLGEFSYPILMQRTFGQSLTSAAGVLLWARVFDLLTVGAILTGTAAALGVVPDPAISATLWVAAACLAIAPAGLAVASRAAAPLLTRRSVLALMAPVSRGATAVDGRGAPLAAVVLSFVIWLVFGLLAALAANAVTDTINPAVALLGASAGNLAFALPVNGIAGLGPSQAAWAALVSTAGVPWSDAVISALAVYAVTFTGALVFGGVAVATGAQR